MQTSTRAYMLTDDEGEAIWFANALLIVKADSAATERRFCMLDQTVPPGYAVPRHIHHAEDEAWYLLAGEVTFFCGDEQFNAGPGAWVFLPKDVPHTFKAGPSGARLLTLSAPSGFVDFVRAAGQPAPERTIPPQQPPDPEQLARLAAGYGVEILGPPPA